MWRLVYDKLININNVKLSPWNRLSISNSNPISEWRNIILWNESGTWTYVWWSWLKLKSEKRNSIESSKNENKRNNMLIAMIQVDCEIVSAGTIDWWRASGTVPLKSKNDKIAMRKWARAVSNYRFFTTIHFVTIFRSSIFCIEPKFMCAEERVLFFFYMKTCPCLPLRWRSIGRSTMIEVFSWVSHRCEWNTKTVASAANLFATLRQFENRMAYKCSEILQSPVML